ncbi:exodeoxyribonuclease VII small subunit [Ligilactobacillus salivarius]|uniref:exodeoxyribonuclease VII small subunit n=1 Tax=Ligilactobacillus salivarius TaxID=1624 RepID=UPI0009DB18B3|nr:exodeoxyribonuclease VII small subunit [Ligilactobacillus salivarius]MBX0282904.1 exodeoxyribonuclease VII small subunit [Ligilactobacillus salivarius]MDE7521381.1 exodeoxyribonuclease VII small subunit [Ligilactobacillus salivarius]OQQ93624.1 exodeoxyribonuclease VII small subunit [Ligilactobacillus salivarius]QIG36042.1 Exodeoxyribonuclease VII small subunit [Ligilactobacillus salivarius]QLL72098.1 exodeoxyribonuclease VII small subunit [Ligilactobacillus salivarius]
MAEKVTFEQDMKNLEEIVKKLEQGDIPLEEAVEKFKQGIDLSKKLQNTLLQAEETLTKVIDDNGDEQLFEKENED